jgi:hypothetical protein
MGGAVLGVVVAATLALQDNLYRKQHDNPLPYDIAAFVVLVFGVWLAFKVILKNDKD